MASIFRLLLAVRILNALLTRTFFQPDEFWQTLEPAHWKAFGYGELTWEWTYGLRSYAFPMIFEVAYRVVSALVDLLEMLANWSLITVAQLLESLRLNDASRHAQLIRESLLPTWLYDLEYFGVIYAPKLVMATIAAIGEYYTIKLIQKVYISTAYKSQDQKAVEHVNYAKLGTVLTLTNFFNSYFITRTFINSFEMSATAVALFYWDWSMGNGVNSWEFTFSLAISTFTTLQRPTNGLVWLVLGAILCLNLLGQHKYRAFFHLIGKAFSISVGSFLLTVLIDYYFYGRLVIPILNFIKFNFTTPLANFYGKAPWHFHLVQSIPIICGYSLPLFIYGMLKTSSAKSLWNNPLRQMKLTLLANLLVYSLLSHKEFRFIYPLQPLILVISTFAAVDLGHKPMWAGFRKSSFIWLVPLLSLVISLVLCNFHESGVIEVMRFLNRETSLESIGFVMPCHSTPWQSYLHRHDATDLWAITCDPPLFLLDDPNALQRLDTYMDESDYLYDNISKFIDENFPNIQGSKFTKSNKHPTHEWPQYLVVYEQLDEKFFNDYLMDTGYIKYGTFFNSIINWDYRRTGDIIVYKKEKMPLKKAVHNQ